VLRGIGIDLVEVARVKDLLERRGARFTARVFTEAEVAYCDRQARPELHFAARFAAKEAAMKLLGTGWADGVGFRDIEVVPDPKGAPRLVLRGRALERAVALGIDRALVSLTHTDGMAAAAVVGEG